MEKNMHFDSRISLSSQTMIKYNSQYRHRQYYYSGTNVVKIAALVMIPCHFGKYFQTYANSYQLKIIEKKQLLRKIC